MAKTTQPFGYPEKAKEMKYLTLKFNLSNDEEKELFNELNGVVSDFRVKKLMDIITNSGNRPGKLTEHEKKLFGVIEMMVEKNSTIVSTPQYISPPIQQSSPPLNNQQNHLIQEKKYIGKINKGEGSFMSNDDVNLSDIKIGGEVIKEKVDYNKILDSIAEEGFSG